MATLAALCSEVYTLTKRPDLVAETELAVRAATLKAHQSDFFARDLAESGIQWSVPDYFQSLDFLNLWPRFRALKFLRKYSGGEPGAFFKVVTPEQVLDSYGLAKSDICYLAGSSIEIKSSTQDTYMLIGLYLNPDTTSTGYNSWISDSHPFVIVYEAARSLYKMIGFDEQAAQFEKLVAEQYQELKLSNVKLVGE